MDEFNNYNDKDKNNIKELLSEIKKKEIIKQKMNYIERFIRQLRQCQMLLIILII